MTMRVTKFKNKHPKLDKLIISIALGLGVVVLTYVIYASIMLDIVTNTLASITAMLLCFVLIIISCFKLRKSEVKKNG